MACDQAICPVLFNCDDVTKLLDEHHSREIDTHDLQVAAAKGFLKFYV